MLVLVEEQPRHGYDLIQEISRRSDGVWTPSPGSIYPALAQLEDEGLVRATEADGRRVFELTEAGRAYVAEHRDDLAAPWEAASREMSDGHREAGEALRALVVAAGQVLHTGSEAQVTQARTVFAEAKRALYRILADDPPAPTP